MLFVKHVRGREGDIMLAMYIGNERIKVVQGIYSNKMLHIKKSATYDYADNRIKTSKTEEKINLVVPAIYNCLGEQGIRGKSVHLVIDDAQSLYRELVVPRSTRWELSSIVYNEMAQILTDIDDYVIDYSIAYEFLHNNVTMYKVSITALTKSAYMKYAGIVRSASLKIKSLDICTNSYSHLMKFYGNFLSDLPYILVDVEDSFVNLILFEQGMRILSRSIDLSAIHVSGEDMSGYQTTISDNISRMMQFQMTQKNRKPVSRLYITGIVPDKMHLEKFLAKNYNLGIGVLPRPPFMKNNDFNINKYSNVLGAML